MAITKSVLSSEPIRELDVAELAPIVKEGSLGKYVFLYDYQQDIFSPEAQQIMEQKGIGVPYNLPKGSFYNLKFSKGDVVDVIDFKKYNNDKGVPVIDRKVMVIDVPKYVKPIGGNQGFKPTIEIDNSSLVWLQKVADSTPVTEKFGVNFGKNINPKTLPVSHDETPAPTITNGLAGQESGSFIEDNKNLLMLAGVLVLAYILLSGKEE